MHGMRRASRRAQLIRVGAVGVVAVGAVVLCSCSGSAASNTGSGTASGGSGTSGVGVAGGSLKVGMGDALVDMDPQTSGSLQDLQILDNIYEGLLRQDPTNGQIEGAVASKWTASPDLKTYTFTIRNGITFQNGEKVTAGDAKWSIARILDPATKATYADDLSPIASMDTPDANTLVIHLKQPYPELLVALSNPVYAAIMPQSNAADITSKPIGTGAFAYESSVPKTSVTLERYSGYWDKPTGPAIDSVEFLAIPDSNSKIQALESGQVQMIDTVPLANIKTVKGFSGLSVQTYPSTWTDYFAMQTASGPFANVKVRQAVVMAIDKSALTQLATFGQGQPQDTMIVPASPIQVTAPALAYNPAQAKQLLSEAGYPNGFSFSFSTCGGTAFPEMVASGQIIASDLQKVGINATFKTEDSGTFANDIFTKHDFTAYVCGLASGLDPDQRTYRYFHTNGPYNAPGYSNPAVDTALDQARATADAGARARLYTQAWKQINQDAPWDILFTFPNVAAMSNKVHGFPLDPNNYMDLNDVSLSK